MAWTTPKTWAIGDVLTAADMNTHVRDNMTIVGDKPKCILYRTANFTLTGGAAIAEVTWDAENVDDDPAGAMHSGSDAHITIQTDGYYLIGYQLDLPIASNFYTSRLYLNDTTYYAADYTTTSSSVARLQAQAVLFASAGEQWSVWAQAGTNTVAIQGGFDKSRLYAIRLSA